MHQHKGIGLYEEIVTKPWIENYYRTTAHGVQLDNGVASIGRLLSKSLLLNPTTLPQPLWALLSPLHLPSRESSEI